MNLAGRPRTRALLSCLVVVAALFSMPMLLLCSATPASAHAYIVATSPAANVGYENPAGTIAISFDEPIDILDSNAISVDDSRGKRVDRHDAAIDSQDATRAIVHVAKDLTPGTYTVHWRVVSADTHVVHGSYAIGVGVAIGAAPAEAASPFDPSAPLTSALRWFSLFGAILAAGAIFLQVLLLGQLESRYPGLLSLSLRATLTGLILILAVGVPSLLVQAVATSGALSGIAATLTHTLWGQSFLVRMGAALVLLLLTINARDRLLLLKTLAAIVLLGTFSATGHALTQSAVPERILLGVVDFAHLLAAAVWIGGVFLIALILVSKKRSGGTEIVELTRTLFVGFSPIALASATTVLVTGTFAAIVHLASVAALVDSPYGRILFVKAAVVIVVLILGYRHLRIADGAIDFRNIRTLGYEAVGGAIVILLTAILVGQMPPSHVTSMFGF